MPDAQNELVGSSGTEYPVVLDEVTDEQLVFVRDIIKKPRRLQEGPVAERHDAWKKQNLIDVLGKVPEAHLFTILGGFIVNVLDKGTSQTSGQAALIGAIMGAFGALASGKLTVEKMLKKEDPADM